MNKPTILTDVDGVLLNFLKAFSEFLKSKSLFKEEFEFKIKGNEYFDLKELITLSCPVECESIINEFYLSKEIGKLKEQQDGLTDIIQSLNNDFNLICITCIGTTEHLKEQRQKNLINVFGDCFKEIHCINITDSKEDLISSLSKKYDVITYVDDRLKHINEAINAGVKPILFIQGYPHNEESNEYYVANCWHDIKSIISSELAPIELTNIY
jgi:DNA-binding beta-propeller fold protein YncE